MYKSSYSTTIHEQYKFYYHKENSLFSPTIHRLIYLNKNEDNGYIHMVRIINLKLAWKG